MPLSRAGRRSARSGPAQAAFGVAAAAALDILELADMAWHDCYGDLALPEDVVDDIFIVGGRDLALFASAARLAVTDRRDLRMTVDRSGPRGAHEGS